MHCIHIQPRSDEWEAMLVIFVKTEDYLAMLQTHKLHSGIFEKMILLCKMLIINCQTCFNLGGSQHCCPPSQNFGGDSPSLPPMIYATGSRCLRKSLFWCRKSIYIFGEVCNADVAVTYVYLLF